MRWLIAVLVAAAVVVIGLQVFDDVFHTPAAFCPDDVDGDDPHGRSELDAHPPDGVLLYGVGEDGMDDQTSQIATRFPSDFPYRPALVCEYLTMSDEQISACPTSGGETIPVVRTRYDYKVYAIPGKELLGVFDLPGTPLCGGIVTQPEIPAEPDYSAVVERLAPLLR
ncbi:hypothetical protein [Amycolatopsis nigrescens]|uniref:hypothetical protein n=1 Tax=Amycolatopsis nigrescens TaxID=381445 RepID=UPI00038027BF|nr:hypothetical protein [Amycolatopsis nigrescens]